MTVDTPNQANLVPVETTVPEHPELNVIAHLQQYVQNYLAQQNLAMQPDSESAAMAEDPNVPDQRQYRFICTTTCGRKFYFFIQSDKHDNTVGAAGHFELDAQDDPIPYEVPVEVVEAQA